MKQRLTNLPDLHNLHLPVYIVFSEACERDWREHEEFASRQISELCKYLYRWKM